MAESKEPSPTVITKRAPPIDYLAHADTILINMTVIFGTATLFYAIIIAMLLTQVRAWRALARHHNDPR